MDLNNKKYITFINAYIESVSPLHIGNDDDLLISEHKAYMPATSIAGTFKAYLLNIGEEAKDLFGSQDSMSNIFVYDAYANIDLVEKRTGVKINKETGSNFDKSKIDREYLARGLNFKLRFEIHSDEKDNKNFKDMIYKCLKALNKQYIRFGAYKTSGAGAFKLNKAEEIQYDLSKFDDFSNYLKKCSGSSKDVTKDVENIKLDIQPIIFKLQGELTTPVLIKAPSSLDSDEVDSVNMKSKDKYVLPGSSLKGIIRARAEKISNYLNKSGFIDMIFGSEKDKKMGSVFVDDAILNGEGYDNTVKYNRIKIDKFTGGVCNSALMNEKPSRGKVGIKVTLEKCVDNNLNKAAAGLLSFVLRDLATENLSIGSGTSIGRGRFKADKMLIECGDEKIDIDYKNKKITNRELLESYINELKHYKCEEDL
ncbi:RAMP superfamily CRISPR-associated protein [Clostridium aestuarii]|uniref:RAMP superfamily CRISPR-associated protein n=1 Tax=Clostridium aestuarii TaxID=338193 RepID=A0ABT4D2J8_9CLOT|nr:RAMP superfamily CRISPR-associated protein [Clostridium aestuarii]MCY6485464.1 RAMP superfamily CRISPR-associated protein [Clostridium aestuarii]